MYHRGKYLYHIHVRIHILIKINRHKYNTKLKINATSHLMAIFDERNKKYERKKNSRTKADQIFI